jgi:diaminohydroxyphosphoribosylaminopyrimidine deaminase/5-amino-6-(5-phosphoribosylamino)uracil reductase
MVGANTVEYDDPRLDYRLGDEPQPACVVVDPNLRTSLSRGIYQTQNRRPVLVAASIDAAPKQVQRFQAQGIEVVQLPVEDGKLQLKPLLKELGSRGIQGLLCEGGGLLGSSLFSQELCNRMLLYRVPKIVGSGGISALVPDSMPDNIEFCLIHSQVIAQDVLSVYDVQYNTVPKIGK